MIFRHYAIDEHTLLAAYALQIAHGYYAAVVLHLAGLHLPNGVVKHQFGGINIYIHSHFVVYIAEESRCQAQFAFIIAVGENFPCQIEVYGIVYALTFYCYHRFAFLNRENGRGKQFYIFLFGQLSRCYRCRFYYLVALLQIGCADIYPKTLIALVNVTFDSGGIHYIDRQFSSDTRSSHGSSSKSKVKSLARSCSGLSGHLLTNAGNACAKMFCNVGTTCIKS